MNQVAILGASGYGGGELLRWLSSHPAVSSLRGTSRARAGQPFWDAHPNLRGILDGRFEAELPWAEFTACEQPVVFSALPHGELAERLPALEAAWAQAGIQDRLLLVDLSGDFRLRDPQAFAEAYGKVHPCPEHLARFVYGLPEWNRAALPGARRIASPGCFATALQLALLPLRDLEIGWMAASAATGSSGSGASPSAGTHHPLRANDFRAYKVLNHQHLAEVRAGMAACGAGAKGSTILPLGGGRGWISRSTHQYFTSLAATGAADVEPNPAFSTTTAKAIWGLSRGAKPAKSAWSFRNFAWRA